MHKVRAKKIKLVLFDVDGVLTDGTIWVVPSSAGANPGSQAEVAVAAEAGGFAVVSRNMTEAKGFHAHDGLGISLARLAGLKTGLITKRTSEAVRLRGRDLRMDYVFQGIADKRAALEEILQKESLTAEEVAYVGDDLIDLPIMQVCGLAFAVPNARQEVKNYAHVITEHAGGQGAARDAIEYVLRAQGKLDDVIARYLSA